MTARRTREEQLLVRIRKKLPDFNPLNAELNPICPLLALFGAHHILHISRIRVKVRNDSTEDPRRTGFGSDS